MDQSRNMGLSPRMDRLRLMSSRAATPARSEALITEESREGSLLADSPASADFTAATVSTAEEAFTAEAAVTVEVTGNPICS
jgi:hypothetical protein